MNRIVQHIDLDLVTITKQADLTACGGFRGNMANGCTTRCTGEAAIRDQCHIFVQSHASQCGSRHQHFTHTGTAFRSFIKDHNDISRMDLSTVDRIDRFCFSNEHPCCAGVNKHFRGNCAALDNAAVFGNVAKQESQSAHPGIRIFDRADDLRIAVLCTGNIFAYALSAHRHQTGMQQANAGQFLHHSCHAARFVEFFHEVVACRCQMAQVGRLFADFIEPLQIKFVSSFVCNGGQV